MKEEVMDPVKYCQDNTDIVRRITNHFPLHDETTSSFKINRWYDFADGKGGNLVDCGILPHRCMHTRRINQNIANKYLELVVLIVIVKCCRYYKLITVRFKNNWTFK